MYDFVIYSRTRGELASHLVKDPSDLPAFVVEAVRSGKTASLGDVLYAGSQAQLCAAVDWDD